MTVQKIIRTIFLMGLLALSAAAAPLKVYLFAGQSNMSGGIYNMDTDYDPAMEAWIDDPSNPVLYHYSVDGSANVTWGPLNANNPRKGQEHVAAYRLWNYWQSVDTNINVAIFIVAQSATSLSTYWAPGGRDRDPWRYEPDPIYMPQGDGYQLLTNRLTLALSQLDDLGHTHRDIEAFFWYQGEGDSYNSFGGDNYRILFEDLVHGWEDRGNSNDDSSAYGGSVRSICGLTNLPTFVARINWQTKGSPSWGPRSSWEPNLISVRSALVDYAESHPNSAWIDVDDIPLTDFYHYTGANYCEIGDRFSQTCIETLYGNGNPYLDLVSPVPGAEFSPWNKTITCSAVARDAAGDAVADSSLSWSSSEEGVFGTGTSASLSNPSWETRITSYGSADDPSAWIYTTNIQKRIKVEYTDPNGNRLVKMHWIQQSDDDSSSSLPIPFSESFEDDGTNSGTLGNLNGQRGWIADAGALVQTGTVYDGSQALSVTEGMASHTFEGAPTNVWATFWTQPVPGAAPATIASNSAAVFYVSTNNLLVAYNATSAVEIAGATVSNGWNKFEVFCDYSSKVWNLWLNGTQVVSNYDFYGSPVTFSSIRLIENSTSNLYVDSIYLAAAQGEPDIDEDGLPDSWEVRYFGGATNANPIATASNGINTLLETYIAGLNPTNPAARLSLDSVQPLTWTAVSGRVYTISWTSNLLSGFQPLETNYTGGAFTDALHSTDTEGFYKIDVRLAP